MNASEFWRIVESTHDGDGDEQLRRLQAELARLSAEDEAGFRACFAGMMRYACSWRLWDASRIAFRGMDDDTFFGVRAWLVSRGSQRYFEVLAEPDTLASGDIASFAAFGRCIVGANDGLVETFSHAPLDHDDVDVVQSTFPQLCARYSSLTANASSFRRRLFTPSECRTWIRRGRTVLVLTLGAIVAAWALLPWYGGLLVSAGCVGALIAWVFSVNTSRTVGGFVSRGRSVGNATQLVGEVEVALVCVRPSGSRPCSWDEGETDAALALLCDEAARHGVELSFRRVEAAQEVLELPSLLGRFDAYDPESIRVLEQVVDAATPSNNGFALVLTTEHACTPTAWMSTRLRSRSLEFCVCPRSASAETIAHEILHLFGAQDLYVSERPGSMTWQGILDDVTAYVHSITGEDITQTSLMTNLDGPGLTVDPLTAAAVGWTERVAGRAVPLFHGVESSRA
ncbi:MAG: DUF4240 domain-containing protein [Myxococcota bacterium]